jgi:hypothetical protein
MSHETDSTQREPREVRNQATVKPPTSSARKGEEEPTIDEYGAETHPAFGLIGASRVRSNATTLFDSDIVHHNTVLVRIKAASRKRDLHRDWIYGNKEYIEVELSEAQWASFVSSMNSGDGVPCTVRHRDGEVMPSFPHDPRLGYSIREAKEAAATAFEDIKEAMDAFDALDPKSPAAVRREAVSRLRSTIRNAESNVTFAGKSLVEMTENVVQRARADVEAFVITKAHQLGIEPIDLGRTLAITSETAVLDDD